MVPCTVCLSPLQVFRGEADQLTGRRASNLALQRPLLGAGLSPGPTLPRLLAGKFPGPVPGLTASPSLQALRLPLGVTGRSPFSPAFEEANALPLNQKTKQNQPHTYFPPKWVPGGRYPLGFLGVWGVAPVLAVIRLMLMLRRLRRSSSYRGLGGVAPVMLFAGGLGGSRPPHAQGDQGAAARKWLGKPWARAVFGAQAQGSRLGPVGYRLDPHCICYAIPFPP